MYFIRSNGEAGQPDWKESRQKVCTGLVLGHSHVCLPGEELMTLRDLKVMCIWCVANRSSGFCSKCHPQTLLCYCLCQFYQYFLGYWSYWYLFFNAFMRKVSLLWLWQILNLHNLFKINAHVQALFILVWPNVQETAVSLSQGDACSSQRKQT